MARDQCFAKGKTESGDGQTLHQLRNGGVPTVTLNELAHAQRTIEAVYSRARSIDWHSARLLNLTVAADLGERVEQSIELRVL